MDFVYYIDEIAAQEHRHELEEQARVERMLADAREASHPGARRFSLRKWLHLRRPEPPTDESVKRN
ncbi:hypothetical protein K2Z83_17335 [Oscillochloris sp. ZM17-4]|uniref:hypothetical protein n=1 Tax=Oscillochloris sp. ZM17-4 TaxID=2866714 RepID=UPI001C734756|nr:hypothetical protein [Oscillochloris sp. ZM17-4]MBX0329437.1 hypothetical protein [Oscillochloris sp. ZM17-4]